MAFGNKSFSPAPYDAFKGDQNKYLARHIIFDKLEKHLDGDGITPDSDKHVHLVVVGADSLMLDIARQAVLLSHYPNFDDVTGENRTRVTILSPCTHEPKNLQAMRHAIGEAFGNLLTQCNWKIIPPNGPEDEGMVQELLHSFVDVEIEVIMLGGKDAGEYLLSIPADPKALTTLIAHDSALPGDAEAILRERLHQVYIIPKERPVLPAAIDVSMASRANVVYDKGCSDRNIYDKDIVDVNRYGQILKKYVGSIKPGEELKKWESRNDALKFSNISCTDCYPGYLRSIAQKKDETLIEAFMRNLKALCRAEHSRWNVERLINGYRAFTPEETLIDEDLSGQERADYRRRMRGRLVHIDICSYPRLRCIDPESIKYDAFLVLAIPIIMESLQN